MTHFFAWYLLLTLLGWLTFPLAWQLFPGLTDRGFSLARALGLLFWGYLFWVLASLGVIQNNTDGLFFSFLLVFSASAFVFWKSQASGEKSILAWIKTNVRLIISVELLFFLGFAAWAFVRASNPNIETAGGEKTMELAFINAILRSPAFPPHDPWLSGYSISYYYFGYVMTAMLAKAAATPGAVAHNLMLALVFALSAIGAYGIIYNLLAAWRKNHAHDPGKPLTGLPLLGPLFLLFVSNYAGLLEILHSRGIFWKFSTDGTASSAFWSWLGIKHLDQPPSLPLQWTPTRFIWWWQDSRVIQDIDLAGNVREIIDEFPAFSYMLGDLHPHVLAMPFGLLITAAALNLFLGGWKGEMKIRGFRLLVSPQNFLSAALLLGGMAFLNTWDILFGFALLAGTYVLVQARSSGWSWQRLVDLFAFGVPLGLLAILLYLPFYVGFSSQAGGILPNLDSPTRGTHLWVMFAPLLLALFAFIAYLWRTKKLPAKWVTGVGLSLGLTLMLWIFSWLLALLVQFKQPDFSANYLASQGFVSLLPFFQAASLKRLQSIASLLTLLALLIPSLAFLARGGSKAQENEADENPGDEQLPSTENLQPAGFVIFLVLLGTLVVLAPEFVYLRDLFGYRINTVFKFYFQAWQLWSLAAALGVAVMLHELHGAWRWITSGIFGLVILAGLAFPAFALPNKTNNFQVPAFIQLVESGRLTGDPTPIRTALSAWTLDGARLFHGWYPDDSAAADWLAGQPIGVVAEAASNDAYSDYGRISVYSGQPAVLGWWWHEYQWRGTFEQQDERRGDLALLYQTSEWEQADAILQKYDIRYVVVGTLERLQYNLDESKFQRHLAEVFRSGDVVIYETPR